MGLCQAKIDFLKNLMDFLMTFPRPLKKLTFKILLNYGVKDAVKKPFNQHEFEDKISYAVEKHLKLSKK